jgi:hypothetical protein
MFRIQRMHAPFILLTLCLNFQRLTYAIAPLQFYFESTLADVTVVLRVNFDK